MPVFRSGGCCCLFFVLQVVLYTGKLLEDVAICSEQEEDGSTFLPGSMILLTRLDIRKPAGLYIIVGRIFPKP